MKHSSSEKLVKAIHRKARRKYSAEEKIRIVLEGLRGEESIAELWRREGLNQNVYYRWSKEFLEAGKQRLAGNTKREATSDEVYAHAEFLGQGDDLTDFELQLISGGQTGGGGGDS